MTHDIYDLEVHAQSAIKGGGERYNCFTPTAIKLLIADLFQLADSFDMQLDQLVNEAKAQYEVDCEDCGSEGTFGQEPGTAGRYTGWDRIHDDNKVEGRPVGGQWSDEGVYYDNGLKLRRNGG